MLGVTWPHACCHPKSNLNQFLWWLAEASTCSCHSGTSFTFCRPKHYWTTLKSACSYTVKSIYWHQAVVKESAAFIPGYQASKCLKCPNSVKAFRERFKRWGEGRDVWSVWWALVDVFWLGVNIINLLIPSNLGSTCLWAAYGSLLPPGGIPYLQSTSKDMTQNTVYCPWGVTRGT